MFWQSVSHPCPWWQKSPCHQSFFKELRWYTLEHWTWSQNTTCLIPLNIIWQELKVLEYNALKYIFFTCTYNAPVYKGYTRVMSLTRLCLKLTKVECKYYYIQQGGHLRTKTFKRPQKVPGGPILLDISQANVQLVWQCVTCFSDTIIQHVQ
jgi:hypothetical protein